MTAIAVNGERIRIYVNERDRHDGRNVCKAIMEKARELDLAGCYAFRGMAGFSRSGKAQSDVLADILPDMPVVIEIVDSPEHIAKIIPYVQRMVADGLVTVEKVRIVRYGAHASVYEA